MTPVRRRRPCHCFLSRRIVRRRARTSAAGEARRAPAVWLAWLVSLAARRLDARRDRTRYGGRSRSVLRRRPARRRGTGRPDLRRADDDGAAKGDRRPSMGRCPAVPLSAVLRALRSCRLRSSPYLASWLVWTVLMPSCRWSVAAAALGVEEKGRWLLWALCFYPVFAAISFGQNSLFSLAILALTFALLQRGRPFLAGMVAGLLLFKPQLLVGVGLLWTLDVRRSWRSPCMRRGDDGSPVRRRHGGVYPRSGSALRRRSPGSDRADAHAAPAACTSCTRRRVSGCCCCRRTPRRPSC